MPKTDHRDEEGKAYWRFIESTYKAADIYNGPRAFLASIEAEPRSAVLVYAAHFAQSEIHNGGLLQFFWNNTGVLAPEAVAGFRIIGMQRVSDALDALIRKLGTPYPRDRDDRWNALLAASERDTESLEAIFQSEQDFYLKFEEATSPLFPTTLNETIWNLLAKENGGFPEAADRYVRSLKLM